jgi:hypothetical protein
MTVVVVVAHAQARRPRKQGELSVESQIRSSSLALLAALLLLHGVQAAEIQLKQDDAASKLTVLIDGKETITYNYSPDHFLPYFYPVLSPSGKELTVKQIDPYPHHRSFWLTDYVQLEGQRPSNFYMAHYPPKQGKGDRIRHEKFLEAKADKDSALLRMQIVWELDKEKPVLDELRDVRIVPLGNAEYFMDVRFTVTASYGDVHFLSDAAHYAWPYIRMNPQFSVAKGGKLVNSEGGVNQKGTCDKVAKWCDYSNTIDGKTEGLAFFSHSENDHPHKWLTRDYGTFGPRRNDAQSGKKFTLKKGESLKRRVGVLIHNGDLAEGKVAERYEQYIKGQLSQLP